MDSGVAQAEIRQRILRYEASAEPLSKIAGVLGRWGDDASDRIVFEVLQSLYTAARKQRGGMTIWLELRMYSAVLIFTAFGIGLTRAGRWESLYRLFTSLLRQEYRESVRAVDALFLWKWQGGADEFWKQLDGLERRRTPLSDHLRDVMASWSTAFAGIVSDFDMLFERFEVLGSLAQVGESSRDDLESTLEKTRDYLWMPVGRSAWHQQVRTAIFRELESAEFREALLGAGFARSEGAFLDAFMKNYDRIAGRHFSW